MLPAMLSFRRLHSSDESNLLEYLYALNQLSSSRFGPHPFTKEALRDFYHPYQPHTGYIAVENETGNIAANFIIRKGPLPHDVSRLQSYGISLNNEKDFTFAPSVADTWQNRGIGTPLLQYIIGDVKTKGAKRLLLWGGVKSENLQAIRFYSKNGFEVLGKFEYNGWNTDMILNL
jgi:GNAT superfamily N-acetyltransferase